MVRCEDCDIDHEHAEDLDHEEVDELDVEDDDDGPPTIQIGVDQRDVWRCKGCGKVLGVS